MSTENSNSGVEEKQENAQQKKMTEEEEEQQKEQEEKDGSTKKKKASAPPLIVIIVGMAGTGKTTFVQRMHMHCVENKLRGYFINLDPAVIGETPFGCNIDIRDTINYKEVMKQYRLGPNGAILTCLNLFATKFDQVISILEKKSESLDYIFIDTPGQIEVFTWSASGQLITEALAASFPTCVLFVGDTSRCTNPQTFMSTMLYSSSILYKSQLPLLVVFNKIDVVNAEPLMQWMKDPDSLQFALKEVKGYAATLTQSLSIFIHEFYENMKCFGVSAITGQGIASLVAEGLPMCLTEYQSVFLPLVQERMRRREKEEALRKKEEMEFFAKDLQRNEEAS